ncbi:MAG: hypothetical protein ACE5EA_03035 [Nitrospirota bacterium]
MSEFLKKYKGEALLFLFALYVFLLGLGVIGEMFDIQWILNLPIY